MLNFFKKKKNKGIEETQHDFLVDKDPTLETEVELEIDDDFAQEITNHPTKSLDLDQDTQFDISLDEETLVINSSILLEIFPEKYLSSSKKELQHENLDDFSLVLNKDEVMPNIGQEFLSLKLIEVISRLPNNFIARNAYKIDDTIKIPFTLIIALIPTNWYKIENQDLSKIDKINKMASPFENMDQTSDTSKSTPTNTQQQASTEKEASLEKNEVSDEENDTSNNQETTQNIENTDSISDDTQESSEEEWLIFPIADIVPKIPKEYLAFDANYICQMAKGLNVYFSKDEVFPSLTKSVFEIPLVSLSSHLPQGTLKGNLDHYTFSLPLEVVLPKVPPKWFTISNQDESTLEKLAKVKDPFEVDNENTQENETLEENTTRNDTSSTQDIQEENTFEVDNDDTNSSEEFVNNSEDELEKNNNTSQEDEEMTSSHENQAYELPKRDLSKFNKPSISLFDSDDDDEEDNEDNDLLFDDDDTKEEEHQSDDIILDDNQTITSTTSTESILEEEKQVTTANDNLSLDEQDNLLDDNDNLSLDEQDNLLDDNDNLSLDEQDNLLDDNDNLSSDEQDNLLDDNDNLSLDEQDNLLDDKPIEDEHEKLDDNFELDIEPLENEENTSLEQELTLDIPTETPKETETFIPLKISEEYNSHVLNIPSKGYPNRSSFSPHAININRCNKEDLLKLHEVDDRIATAIIEYRENNGYFVNLQDLLEVDEISEELYQSITRLSSSSAMVESERLFNTLVGLDEKRDYSLKKLISQAVEHYKVQSLILSSYDGLQLAIAGENTNSETLSAVAPQIFKRTCHSLTQANLPQADLFTFYLDKSPISFLFANEVFLTIVHKGNYPTQEELEQCKKLAEYLSWFFAYRATI